MTALKFTVVIPVYNAEQYIVACISSVLEQTHPHFEAILVDDGSTDGSGSICDEFAARNPEKVRTIHMSNRGALLARETGVEQARGNVLVFLDSDDCLRKDALETIARSFARYDCDMVFYSASSTDDFKLRDIGVPYKDGTCFSNESKKQVYCDLITGKIPNSLCLKAVKTDLYNLAYDRSEYMGVRHGEDLLISALLIHRAKSIAVSDQNLYFYRRHEGSVTTSFNPAYIHSVSLVHRKMEEWVDVWEIPEMKSVHYARIVRSWAQAAKQICRSRDIPSAATRNGKLRECSEDSLFRRAYTNMDDTDVKLGDKLIAWCLFREAFDLLWLVCNIGSGVSVLKRIAKSVLSRG